MMSNEDIAEALRTANTMSRFVMARAKLNSALGTSVSRTRAKRRSAPKMRAAKKSRKSR